MAVSFSGIQMICIFVNEQTQRVVQGGLLRNKNNIDTLASWSCMLKSCQCALPLDSLIWSQGKTHILVQPSCLAFSSATSSAYSSFGWISIEFAYHWALYRTYLQGQSCTCIRNAHRRMRLMKIYVDWLCGIWELWVALVYVDKIACNGI